MWRTILRTEGQFTFVPDLCEHQIRDFPLKYQLGRWHDDAKTETQPARSSEIISMISTKFIMRRIRTKIYQVIQWSVLYLFRYLITCSHWVLWANSLAQKNRVSAIKTSSNWSEFVVNIFCVFLPRDYVVFQNLCSAFSRELREICKAQNGFDHLQLYHANGYRSS